jgi:methionyl aminopeptidase
MSGSIFYKTKEDVELIRQSGAILSKLHGELAKMVKPGVKTKVLDKYAEEYIRDNNGLPSFKGYGGFPASLCISVNEAVVHGLPSDYELTEGDIVTLDCGVLYKGFHSDSAYTHAVGEIKPEIAELLRVTKECLYLGIAQVKQGGRLGDVGYTIQKHAEKHNFTVVRELVGHGIGKSLHEEPQVANYGRRGNGVILREGIVIAIEPMINLGKKEVELIPDGTVRTKDRQPSAHFEHTVAIIGGKCEVLTTFDYIEKN